MPMPPVRDSFVQLVPLFTDAGWIKHANTVVSADGKTLTLSATATGQSTYMYINVIPGVTYTLSMVTTASSGNTVLSVRKLPGSNSVDDITPQTNKSGNVTVTFAVPQGTTQIRVILWNDAIGTFTFSNLSLVKAVPAYDPTKIQPYDSAKRQDYFKELVVNGDFSQGLIGWTVVGGTWDTLNSKAVLTSTGNSQSMYQTLNISPNTQYVLKADEATAKVAIYNAQASASIIGYTQGQQTRSFNSGNNASVRLYLSSDNLGAGVFTFDNISLKRAIP
jgi:hypothetical protein